MLNRRQTQKKKTAKMVAVEGKNIAFSPKINIDSHIEKESEKWLRSSLFKGLWDYGYIKRDGTEIERMLHELIYARYSQKVKKIIEEGSKSSESSE